MPKQPPTYDLMVLLSTSAEEDQRGKVLNEVESAISDGGGSIEHRDDWGRRTLTYPINHQGDAEYHLLQFQGPAPLLETLSQRLRITDGVLRFRIIKAVLAAPESRRSTRPDRGPTAADSDGADGDSPPTPAGATADPGGSG